MAICTWSNTSLVRWIAALHQALNVELRWCMGGSTEIARYFWKYTTVTLTRNKTQEILLCMLLTLTGNLELIEYLIMKGKCDPHAGTHHGYNSSAHCLYSWSPGPYQVPDQISSLWHQTFKAGWNNITWRCCSLRSTGGYKFLIGWL